MAGPNPQLPSYTLACGRYNGFSPSMSRELMSLPMVYPMIAPLDVTARVSSGSGTFHRASRRMRTVWPDPRTRCGLALKNNSGRAAP